MRQRTFVGFGFGAIQSGLFLAEAHKCASFSRLVVAEVLPSRVNAIRNNHGTFAVNIATPDGRIVQTVDGVEILNPAIPDDAVQLTSALAEASEVATALPSIDFFERGSPSVASLLAAALRRKIADPALPATIVYTAENNNHAAEALQQAIERHLSPADRKAAGGRLQTLNTVIGKMCGVVTAPEQIARLGLAPLVPGADEAFLVEAFARILISRIVLPDFDRGIAVFEEQPDLRPFEDAKLYGHNAVHAALGYLAHRRGLRYMSEIAKYPDLLGVGRSAFIDEAGQALIRKHAGIDPLFTAAGFSAYAEDLLTRMTNPWLQDAVARVVRDPLRKLGWHDRLIGAIRLALDHGIQPVHLLAGARAALGAIPNAEPLRELIAQWERDGADDPTIQIVAGHLSAQTDTPTVQSSVSTDSAARNALNAS